MVTSGVGFLEPPTEAIGGERDHEISKITYSYISRQYTESLKTYGIINISVVYEGGFLRVV